MVGRRKEHGIRIDDTDLAWMLDEKMTREGLTYAVVASVTGVSESTVFSIRKGRRTQVLAAVLDGLARLLGAKDRRTLLDHARRIRAERAGAAACEREELLARLGELERELGAARDRAKCERCRAHGLEQSLDHARRSHDALLACVTELRCEMEAMRQALRSLPGGMMVSNAHSSGRDPQAA